MERVDYNSLDSAKNQFIAASRSTLEFARPFGFVPDHRLGASANIFQLDLKNFLAAGADALSITLLPEGLGTADDARPTDLSEAEQLEFWRNIGLKTISCLTNDAASAGLQTVLLSLYLPSSNPEQVFSPQFMSGFLDGIVSGCRTVGCVYLSGETPQLKTKIYPNTVDLAGALFALSPPGIKPVASDRLEAGQTIVFIASSGPHENGFTTLRKMAEELPNGYRTKLPSGMEYWRALNQPGILYTALIQEVVRSGIQPTNIEPITGHGWQKLMRSHKPLHYRIEQVLPVPEVFTYVEEYFSLSKQEMLEIFNYGVGLAVFVENFQTGGTRGRSSRVLGSGSYHSRSDRAGRAPLGYGRALWRILGRGWFCHFLLGGSSLSVVAS